MFSHKNFTLLKYVSVWLEIWISTPAMSVDLVPELQCPRERKKLLQFIFSPHIMGNKLAFRMHGCHQTNICCLQFILLLWGALHVLWVELFYCGCWHSPSQRMQWFAAFRNASLKISNILELNSEDCSVNLLLQYFEESLHKMRDERENNFR